MPRLDVSGTYTMSLSEGRKVRRGRIDDRADRENIVARSMG